MKVFNKKFGGVDIGKVRIGGDIYRVVLHDDETDENAPYFHDGTYESASHGDVIIYSTAGGAYVFAVTKVNEGECITKTISGHDVTVSSFDVFVEVKVA